MHQVSSNTKGKGGSHWNYWSPDVPFLTRPALKSEKKKLISGVYYYRGINGKLYVCKTFDFFFGKKGE
jgi:hypothetical protein